MCFQGGDLEHAANPAMISKLGGFPPTSSPRWSSVVHLRWATAFDLAAARAASGAGIAPELSQLRMSFDSAASDRLGLSCHRRFVVLLCTPARIKNYQCTFVDQNWCCPHVVFGCCNAEHMTGQRVVETVSAWD